MILHCGCQMGRGAIYQDDLYGVGRRVHNKTTKENSYRCTLCGAERGTPGQQLSKKEQKALKEAEKAEKSKKLAGRHP